MPSQRIIFKYTVDAAIKSQLIDDDFCFRLAYSDFCDGLGLIQYHYFCPVDNVFDWQHACIHEHSFFL